MVINGCLGVSGRVNRHVHPSYSFMFVTEFNRENGFVNSVTESLVSKCGNVFCI